MNKVHLLEGLKKPNPLKELVLLVWRWSLFAHAGMNSLRLQAKQRRCVCTHMLRTLAKRNFAVFLKQATAWVMHANMLCGTPISNVLYNLTMLKYPPNHPYLTQSCSSWWWAGKTCLEIQQGLGFDPEALFCNWLQLAEKLSCCGSQKRLSDLSA